MLNLIRLELRKFNFKRYLVGYLISMLVLIALILIIFYAPYDPELFDLELNGQKFIMQYDFVIMYIQTLSAVTFTIFSSVILSRLVIGEYKNKTISLMFMYPINRKKLIISKLLIVVIFTYLSIVLADLIMGSIFLLMNSYFHLITERLTVELIYDTCIGFVFQALSSAGVSLVPLFFGMRKKSVPTTILSAVLISCFIYGNIGNINLSSIVIIPASLALAGILIAYFSIRNIEHADVTN